MKLSQTHKMVLDVARRNGVVSINDIVQSTPLSSATGSRLINKLVDEDFLEEVTSKEVDFNGTKGRPQRFYKYNAKNHYVIGLDIGSTSIKGGIMNLNGVFVKEIELENNHLTSPEVCFKKINNIIDSLYNNSIVEKEKILGVGVAFAGLINKNDHIIKFSPTFNWHDLDPKSMLNQVDNLPMYYDNVTKLMALGEIYLGYGNKFSNFIFVNIGYGIGASIVTNGKLYYGSNGYSSEFGHVISKPDSHFLCPCGQKGCLTTTSSGEYIKKRAIYRMHQGEYSILKKYKEDDISAKIIFQEAKNGDKLCKEVVDVAINNLAYRLLDIDKIINPEAIILGGGITLAEDFFFDKLRMKMNSISMNYPRPLRTKVLPRTFKHNATLIRNYIIQFIICF